MAVRLAITIEQGATFNSFEFVYWTDESKTTPVNIDGWTVRCQIRQAHDSAAAVYDSQGTGHFTVTGAEGKIAWNIPDEVTANLPAPFQGVFDITLTDPDGNIKRFIEGPVTITPRVTR